MKEYALFQLGRDSEAGGDIHKSAQNPSNASIRFKLPDDSEQVERDKREGKCGCVFHGVLAKRQAGAGVHPTPKSEAGFTLGAPRESE